MENLQTKVTKENKYEIPPTLLKREISTGKKHSLFVEQYLEPPVYKGDMQMLTIPTACTFKGVPLLDDF